MLKLFSSRSRHGGREVVLARPLNSALVRLAGLIVVAASAQAQMTLEYLNFHGAQDDIAVDGSGCVYVLGNATADKPIVTPAGLPCAASPPVSNGGAWIAKLDASGEIVWSRVYNSGPMYGIAVDDAGTQLYTCGWAGTNFASQFPEGGWDMTVDGSREGYVARFDASTGCPLSGTFFGPRSDGSVVAPHAIAIDPGSGEVHIVGNTTAVTYSTTATLAGYTPAAGSMEAFVVGFDGSLQSRSYFAYLPGGSEFENAQDVVLDASGIYVSGTSASPNLTFTPERIGPGGGQDVFVMKLDNPVTSLTWASFIGGSGDEGNRDNNGIPNNERGAWLAVDSLGQVSVASWTASNDFPTTNGSTTSGNDEVFVTKLGATGAGPALYSTLIGGNRNDVASGLARDAGTQRVYVVGSTKSSGFPTPGGLVTQHSSSPSKWDAFLIEVDDTNGALLSGTFLGGTGEDTAYGGVGMDGAGNVYMGGARSNGFQPARTSQTFTTTAYVAKIHFGVPVPTPGISVAPTSGLVTTESGGTDDFSVVLDTAPTAAVSIDVSSSDTSEGLVSSGAQGPAATVTLVFDGVNWNVPQTVTLTGQDDPTLDGDVAYTAVTSAAVSGDIDYAGLNAADVAATNLDDEVPPGIAVTGIAPGSMDAGTTVNVTITGSGFVPGAVVSFENGTGPAPSVSNVVVLNGTTIDATFTAGNGGPKGVRTWDIRVTNPDSSTGVLAGGFQVIK